MIKAVIIEDELVAAENVLRGLTSYAQPVEVMAILRSVEGAIEWLSENKEPIDIIFADIKLPDGDSFDIFNQVSVAAFVVFTTAYDEYALRAFKLNSLDYILKPVSSQDLKIALDKWQSLTLNNGLVDLSKVLSNLSMTSKYKERFLVKYRSELRVVEVQNIAYFFADGNFVCFYDFKGNKYPIDYSLETLEDLLDPKFFFRATRNMMTNLKTIQSARPYFKGKLKLVLEPCFEEHEFVVSSQRAQSFKNWLNGAI